LCFVDVWFSCLCLPRPNTRTTIFSFLGSLHFIYSIPVKWGENGRWNYSPAEREREDGITIDLIW
jgi:hypothetical protein